MPVLAREHSVTVQFRPGTTTQFIQILSQTFRARILKHEQLTYIFEVPALKTQEQYTELFAALPSVSQTDPAPTYRIADHIMPQAINLQAVPDPYASAQAAKEAAKEAAKVATQATPAPTASPAASASPATASSAAPNLPPSPPVGNSIVTSIPLDGGGQMQVSFKPGTSEQQIRLFHQIYGTRNVKKLSFYTYRIQLPAGFNPALAERVLKLFPEVSNVQRLYA